MQVLVLLGRGKRRLYTGFVLALQRSCSRVTFLCQDGQRYFRVVPAPVTPYTGSYEGMSRTPVDQGWAK